MLRVVSRRSAASVWSAWRAQPRVSAVPCPGFSLVPNVRSISTGLLSEKKNIAFSPKNATPDVGLDVELGQTGADLAPAEIDLTQFLVQEPSVAASVAEVVEKIGPITATDVGLTWWCPTGGMFKVFEFLHEQFPWWGAIAVATLIARLLMTPFVVKSQRNTAKMSESMPQILEAQAKFQKARRIGNQADIMKASQEMQEAMIKSNYSFWGSLGPVVVQAPIFMSFFLSLRAMTSYPVDGMSTEGLFWFTDLTTPDPYFILPIVTSATLFAVFKMGVEFGNGATPAGMGPQLAGVQLRTLMIYGMPACVLLFSKSFAAGILMYWCTSNAISVVQVFVLNQPKIRSLLNIPEMKKPDPADMKPKKKRGLTETWEEMKLSNQLEDRSRILSEQAFAQAATGPVRKTYKTDPTKKGE